MQELISFAFIRGGSGQMGERIIRHRCLPTMQQKHYGFFLKSGDKIRMDTGSLRMKMKIFRFKGIKSQHVYANGYINRKNGNDCGLSAHQ